jgi:DNA-binding PadR family transcriptional regulator
MPRELTTTSYAILGWLAVKPWPIYEIAKQTRRNLRFFWPRAESRLYDEPKNLVAHGLAKATRTHVGKRPRTTYAITPKGRRALEEWLARPSAPPVLEFEALVRVFFAASGSRESLLATLEGADQLADEIMLAGTAVAREFLEGRHELPERVHLSGLLFDFLWSWGELLRRWTRESRAEVGRWKDLDPEGKRERALRLFEKAINRRT